MTGTALIDFRCDDPDVAGKLGRDLQQRLQPRRMDAVVIGDEDARPREVGWAHLREAGTAMDSRPPM